MDSPEAQVLNEDSLPKDVPDFREELAVPVPVVEEVIPPIADIREALEPHQVTALDELREAINPQLIKDSERRWCTDRMLCRYLRARDWDKERAERMLVDTLQWRREFKAHLFTHQDVLGELNNEGKFYRNGHDREGRPILCMKPGRDNTGINEKDEKLRYVAYMMEKGIRATDESRGIEKLALLIDFKGFSQLTGIGNMKISKESLDILQNHYPERLGRAYIINAPWIFNIFWSVISPLIHENTKKKIRFIKRAEDLLEYIAPDQLEVEYGGENSFLYNFELHKTREDDEFPVLPDD